MDHAEEAPAGITETEGVVRGSLPPRSTLTSSRPSSRFWAPRLLISAAPLVPVPLLFALLAGSLASFGGGEKDLALLVPWAGWSILFLTITLIGWRKRLSIPRCVLAGIAGATILSVLAWGILGLVAPSVVGIQW